MVDTTIRLRVVVQRNGLPEIKYMLPVSLSGNPTNAKLLELVNACTPLESDNWGLDDYVIEHSEPGGHECIHWHPMREVLRDNDQVYIRPLQTDELKRRRLGGREQISQGGQHLTDGVPFGRPLLRSTPSRPEIHIPPRKRRRLLPSSDDEDDNLHDDQDGEGDQLLLTNGEDGLNDEDFDPAVGNDDSGSDSEDGGMDEDLDDELQHLVRDNAEVDEAMEDASPISQQNVDSRRSTAPLGQITLEALDHIGALRAAFPAAPIELCERILAANHNDLRLAYVNLKEAFNPALPESAVISGNLYNTRSRDAPRAAVAPTAKYEQDTNAFNTGEDGGDDKIDDEDASGSGSDGDGDDVPDIVRRYDRCGLPAGTISSGHGVSGLAAITGSVVGADGQEMPRPTRIVFADEDDAEDTTSDDESSSSSEADSSSDEDDDSESDSEDSDSGGTNHGALPDHEMADEGSDSDDSSFQGDGDSLSSSAASDSENDDGSDSDSSDSGPEETTTKQIVAPTKSRIPAERASSSGNSSESGDSNSDDSSDDSSSSDESSIVHEVAKSKPTSKEQVRPTVPPRQGKLATKSRNARRRAAQKFRKQLLMNVEVGNEKQATTGDPTLQTTDEKAAFEAKRQALLDALANGGIEIGPGGSSNLEQINTSTPSSKRKRDEEQKFTQEQEEKSMDADNGANPEPFLQAPTPESQQKRQRFNLDAGKRLLFGALGLRAPKTADEAEKVRTQLMKDVRPLVNARLEADKQKDAMSPQTEGQRQEDPDAWREKISYRAVECCQEGIVLSEPPFPFVQRWDPQQQGLWNGKKNKRGGKGKKADRNQPHYYEEDNRTGKKRKHDETEASGMCYDDTTFNGVADLPDDDAVLDYDDPLPDAMNNDRHGETSQSTDVDDLPSIPKDVSTLPSLLAHDAKVGMVITWKKWSCSAATKWQPLVSDVTAVIIRAEHEGATLEVCLARRDRHLDGAEKRYDEITGQRLYDKFEAPDIDDDEDDNEAFEREQEDDGYRTLELAELIEPRIVQQPAGNAANDKPETEQTNGNAQPDPALALIPSIEQSSGQASDPNGPPAISDARHGEREREDDINMHVLAQSGKSSMLLFGNSSSDATSVQAGQGQQASDIPGQELLREPSPEQQHSSSCGKSSSVGLLNNQLMEDPSGYEGDLDTQVMDNQNSIVHETQPGTGSSENTPTPFHDAMSNASAPHSDDDGNDVQMFEDHEVIASTPHITHPRRKEPSPMSSVASGRQPDPTAAHEVIEPDTYKSTSTSGVVVSKVLSCASGDDSDDPFASDDDIPHDVATRSSRALKDADYEAVISELDKSPGPSLAERENPSTSTRTARTVKTEMIDAQTERLQDGEDMLTPKLKVASLIRSSSLNAPISPPAMKSGRKAAGTTPVSGTKLSSAIRKQKGGRAFSVPLGSQVVNLLSSSDFEDHQSIVDADEAAHVESVASEEEDETVFMENYADDDKDANYKPRAPARSVIDSLGSGSARKVSHFKGTSTKKQKNLQRASTVDSNPVPSSQRCNTRLTASQPDRDGVTVLDSQESSSRSPPASAPVQSAFSAVKKGRKLGASSSQTASSGSSGGSRSSSTARKSWAGGTSGYGGTKSAAATAASRF